MSDRRGPTKSGPFHTNGEEVIMIAVNPVNAPVRAYFDFDCVGDRRIAESSDFDILFSSAGTSQVTSPGYKADRTGAVDLPNNLLLRSQRHQSGSDGRLPLILERLMCKSSVQPVSGGCESGNGWHRLWSNERMVLGGGHNSCGFMVRARRYNGGGRYWYALLRFEGVLEWLWSNYVRLLQGIRTTLLSATSTATGRTSCLGMILGLRFLDGTVAIGIGRSTMARTPSVQGSLSGTSWGWS